MKRNGRVMITLAAAFLAAGVLLHQEREISRLRAAISELADTPREGSTGSTVTHLQPVDIEEFRREITEVRRLIAVTTQFDRGNVDESALQKRVDRLSLEVSAILESMDPRSARRGRLDRFNSVTRLSPEEVAALPPGIEQDRATLASIARLNNTDPVSAAAWATELAEGPLREQALALVAREWGRRDWIATSSWMEELPMGPSKDAAIEAFVSSADGNDIRLALEWANQTEDPTSRAKRVEETALRWLSEDNAAARAWLEKAQLPPGLAERLLSAK